MRKLTIMRNIFRRCAINVIQHNAGTCDFGHGRGCELRGRRPLRAAPRGRGMLAGAMRAAAVEPPAGRGRGGAGPGRGRGRGRPRGQGWPGRARGGRVQRRPSYGAIPRYGNGDWYNNPPQYDLVTYEAGAEEDFGEEVDINKRKLLLAT